MATGYVWHELYAWLDSSIGSAGVGISGLNAQPFPNLDSPETKSRINSIIHVSGLIDHLTPIVAKPATDEDLLRVHPREYVEKVRATSEAGGGRVMACVAPIGRATFDIAKLAAGGTIAATRSVLEGEVRNSYALVRPCGHHALAESGMGLCVFANIAIAIEWARANYPITRAAVVDWDVHHGNGTQAIYESDPHILAISIHQDSLYPTKSGPITDRGIGDGHGATLNIPLPAGTGNGGYVDTIRDVVGPALRSFQPEIIFVASGLDASALDPCGNQVITSSGYRDMTRELMAIADELCDGRIVMSHEGGYSPIYTPYCGLAILEELSGVRTDVVDPIEPAWIETPTMQTTEAQHAVISEAADLARSMRSH